MTRLAADHDGFAAAAGQSVGDGGVGIEAVAMLIERRHRQICAELDRAALGRQRPSENLDQRGLAAAVRPDDADTVAAHDARRETADNGPVAVALADPFGLDDQRPGLGGVARRDVGFPGRAAIGSPHFAQAVQSSEALDVALAPSRYAVAQPMLLGDDLA